MKNLVVVFFFLLTTSLFGQNWQFVGSSTGINNASEVDIEISPNGVLFMAYIDSDNSNKITVKKWQSNAWVLVGTAAISSANAFDVQLIMRGEFPVVGAKVLTTISTTTYEFLEVFAFNGTAWDPLGVGTYFWTEHDYDFALSCNTANELFVTYYNLEFQTYPVGLITVKLGTSTMIGGGIADSGEEGFFNAVSAVATTGNNVLLAFNEATVGNNIITLGQVAPSSINYSSYDAMNSASKIVFEKGTMSSNYSCMYKTDGGTPALIYRTYNGTSFGNSFNIASGTTLADFDFTNWAGINYVFYRLGTTCLFRQFNGEMNPSGLTTITSGTALAPTNATSLSCESNQGAHVIAYISSGKVYVKEYNVLGNIEDYDNFVMCEGTVFNNNSSNSIYLLDPNYNLSNLSMTVTSQNVAVIPNSAVSVSGNGLAYNVFVTTTNDVATSTIVDLEFSLIENGVTTQTVLIPITVHPKPTITFTNPVNAICENASPVHLNNWVNPSGGTWTGNGVVNNVFYPDFPTTSTVNLSYSKTNNLGCTSSDVATITILQTPDVVLTTTNSDCNATNGSAFVTVSNGQAPYLIYWSSGSTQSAVTNLAAGQYLVTVKDDNNCMTTEAVMIGSNGMTQTGTVTPVSCFGNNTGAIDVSLTGGTSPITYSWSNGSTVQDLLNVPAGPYELTVTDATGCVSTASYMVASGTQIMLNNVIQTTPACSASNGSIALSFNGGTLPYSFAWEDFSGATVGTNSATLNAVPAGSYTCTLTDALGCTLSVTEGLSNTFGPVVAIDTVIAASCSNDGQIQTTVISGNPQTYQWSNGATTASISGLSPGNYSCIITGNSGCVQVLEETVNSAAPDPVSICLVTVDTTTNTNLVVWEKPITNAIDHFNIYRETSTAGLYQYIDQVNYSDESIYNDLVASPSVRSWRYKITSVDACGTESEISDHHKTIHLVINQGLGTTYNLSWDSYEGFNYSAFQIWRYTAVDGWNLLQTMPTNLFTYTDTPPSENDLEYLVVVDAPQLCSTTKAQDFNATRSNRDKGALGGATQEINEEWKSLFSVYPNPSNGEVWVKQPFDQTAELTITDVLGRVVKTLALNPGTTALPTLDLEEGSYCFSIEWNGYTAVQKVVISNP